MKNIIMMLSAGRSGTGKLAEIYSRVEGVYAEHEGDPGFHTCRHADEATRKEFLERKLEFWHSRSEHSIVHTGHMASLGFFEFFPTPPDAIILRRPKREVALSLFNLHYIPGKSKYATQWWCGPNEVGVLPYPGWEKAHAYQLCYWWTLEAERRARHYRPLLGKVYETTLEDILNVKKFNRMSAFFLLPPIDAIPQHKVNHYEYNHVLPLTKPIIPEEYLLGLEQEVIDRTMTLQTMGVDDAHLISSNVAINTINAMSHSFRKSEIQTTGYVTPCSLEI